MQKFLATFVLAAGLIGISSVASADLCNKTIAEKRVKDAAVAVETINSGRNSVVTFAPRITGKTSVIYAVQTTMKTVWSVTVTLKNCQIEKVERSNGLE